MAESTCTTIKITVASVLCKSLAPTVAMIKMGPAVEQKLHALVAVAASASLSEIALAPIGYPHRRLIKNTRSQEMPNSALVNERLLLGTILNVRVESTAKGNSAGNTLYAHTVRPSKKLCMYFDGADMNTATTATNSSVIVTRKNFT